MYFVVLLMAKLTRHHTVHVNVIPYTFCTMLCCLSVQCCVLVSLNQLSNAEVQDDATHILGQLSSLPSDFKGIAQAILDNHHSRERLVCFVRDAVNHLHLAPAPETCKTEYGYSTVKDITEESCVVVMVMVQWLVLYMSKRLLQLMTAEALILSRK